MNFYEFMKTRVEHTEIIQGEENSHEYAFTPFSTLSLMYKNMQTHMTQFSPTESLFSSNQHMNFGLMFDHRG